MNRTLKLIVVALIVLIVGGCSGNSSDPVTPATDNGSGPPITGTSNDNLSHELWMSGTINIDQETMTAEVVPDRNTDAHYQTAADVPISVVVNSIDVVNWIVDVDVTIFNGTDQAGFDVRMIIMASSAGHKLLNADDWTMNFDDGVDGYPINPFKAYAKSEPSREFLSGFDHTENLLISIPGGNTNVRYAIDASWPQNCEEPYEISGFTHAELWDSLGSEAIVEVDVFSWSDDVNSVELYLPDVTGVEFESFTLDAGNHWTLDLSNMAPAPIGDYVGYVKATTTGSGALALFDEVIVSVIEDPTPEYVGSDRCGTCHSGKHANWSESGHPFALNKTEGLDPVYPFSVIPNPPPGYLWSDISYVIGGYGWGALFTDSDGYIVTGLEARWRFGDSSWQENHDEDPPGTRSFNCGRCHATGWVSTGDGGPHQDDLPGMAGIFAEDGIGCEKCHGPGGDHVNAPSPGNINLDDSTDLCGQCHSSGDLDQVRIRSGYISGHSQVNEILNGPKSWAKCSFCHDVHSGASYDDQAIGDGVKACTDCHDAGDHQIQGPMNALNCTDCHMPQAAKAHYVGYGSGEGVHATGDQSSHILQIDTSGVPLEDFFDEVGGRDVIKKIDGEVKLNLAWA